MNKLIIIRGPLGVGKTTISRILAEIFDIPHISVDQVIDDNALVSPNADGIPVESFLKANEIIVDMFQKNVSMIVDGCFYYKEQIEDLIEKVHGDAQVITLTSPIETCILRDAHREKVYGEDSARFVHMVTTNLHAGTEIDTGSLTIDETIEKIKNILSS